jgi:predicted nucleotidyltransferase
MFEPSKEQLKLAESIGKNFGLKKIVLFCSVTTENANKNSDSDIAILRDKRIQLTKERIDL